VLLSFEAWPLAHLLGLMAVEEFSLLPDVIEGTEGVFAVPAEPAFRARLLVFNAVRAETPGAMTPCGSSNSGGHALSANLLVSQWNVFERHAEQA
jgi:hypothetical protein